MADLPQNERQVRKFLHLQAPPPTVDTPLSPTDTDDLLEEQSLNRGSIGTIPEPLSPTQADDLLEREARAMLARGQPRDATNIAQTIEDEPRRAWLIEWIAFQVLPGHE
jgi:hypothetical protein